MYEKDLKNYNKYYSEKKHLYLFPVCVHLFLYNLY